MKRQRLVPQPNPQKPPSAPSLYRPISSSYLFFRNYREDVGEADIQHAAFLHQAGGWPIGAGIWVLPSAVQVDVIAMAVHLAREASGADKCCTVVPLSQPTGVELRAL